MKLPDDMQNLLKQSVDKTIRGHNDLLNESFVAEPKTFKQVSELVSHKSKEAHTAIYSACIEAFNAASTQLDTASRGEANSSRSLYRSLKVDEALNANAVWLHELYFANCYDPHSEVVMDSSAFIELQRSFGTFEDWQRDFMACAASTVGWAICGYSAFFKRYINVFIDDDASNVMMGVFPLIVIDCHEHAFARDYLTDKKSYVIAMMRELNWSIIEERFNKAKAIAQAIK